MQLFGGIFVASLWLVFGGFGIKAFVSCIRAGRSKNWQAVPAKIILCEVSEIPAGMIRFLATISYEYEVNGRLFTSNHIHDGHRNTTSPATQRRIVESFKKNKIAYYDPTNPARSVVVRGIPWMLILEALNLFALAVGAGILSFYMLAR